MSLGAPVQNLRQRQYFVRTSAGLSSTPTSSGLIGPALARRQTSEMCWTEQEAYWHTIVTGNDGHVLNRLPHVADEKGNVDWVSYEQPLKWFKANARNAPWRITVYAHGGLNSEGDSIERIRLLGPCFRENGIFPVFTTWKSGWHETLGGMLTDGMKNLFGDQIAPRRGLGDMLVEASDRALEVFLRGVIGKSIWSEMKENVTRSTEAGRGVDQLAEQLKRLAADSGGKLQVHLVGHSAGSFICGRLLSELQQKNIQIKSCTLYAPACDLKFALDYFKPAIEGNQLARSEFRIHVLSDRLERDDSVGPYQKSLLYLVSRALDRWHKTPLLGLANAYDGARITEEYWHSDTLDLVKQWQKFFWGGSVPKGFAADGKAKASGNLHVLSASQVNVGTRYIKSSHGCFDNDLDVIRPTLKNIFGSNLRRDVIDLDY
jgi:pimeloyl-ACP methyl ester carboxylesterase